MQVTTELDKDLWRAFLDQHSQANIFHTPEMFRVFAQTKKHQPLLWATVNSYGEPLALFLPVEVTLFDGVARGLTTRAIAYGSVLYTPGPDGEAALRLLIEAYKKEASNSLFTELRNLSDFGQIQPALNDQGFVYEDHLNFLIDLTCPPEEVLMNIGRRTRKKIRKGLRDKIVQIDEVTTRAELDDWYETLLKTYSYSQVPLADRSLFDAAFEELYPTGMAKFLTAKVDEVIAACSLELLYKDLIYGWYGGTDREYSKQTPNELLIWHILEWGSNNNYRLYDFGGAGKPDEEYGVRDFKAKFGGELVNFGRNTCVHNPTLLKLSKSGYKLYRQLL